MRGPLAIPLAEQSGEFNKLCKADTYLKNHGINIKCITDEEE